MKLASHIQLRTRDSVGISVGGRGVIQYDDVERLDPETMALTERWLDVPVRRDLEH